MLFNEGVQIANVTFEPGCHNHWHVHRAAKGGGQVLLVTAGHGWLQIEGEEAQGLEPGQVAFIPANVKHWHGAKANAWFSHIAIELPGEALSNEKVEDLNEEEYQKLPLA